VGAALNSYKYTGRMGYIYLITNMINKKQYVGQTLRDDIKTRWRQHTWRCNINSGTCISNAFKKYGVETFKFQIICICFDEACNQLEIDYIKKFNTLAPNGYNLESGGNNHKTHPDTIKKLSELNKGENNPQFGKKWTEEFRIKRSKQTIGDKNPNFGKKSANRKSVGMYNLENELIKVFDNIHGASIETSINETSISAVCNGRQKRAGRFIWKFISDQILIS